VTMTAVMVVTSTGHLRRRFRGIKGRADQRHPPPLTRAFDIARSVSVFLEYVDRALSFELGCDVDGGPAEERASQAPDNKGDDVTCPVHDAMHIRISVAPRLPPWQE